MDKTLYNTETQYRLAQVLKGLNLKAFYEKSCGVFIAEDNSFVIYETEESKENLNDILKLTAQREAPLIQIHPNGTLTYDDGSEVRIKYCKTCKKFYFGTKQRAVYDFCPVQIPPVTKNEQKIITTHFTFNDMHTINNG